MTKLDNIVTAQPTGTRVNLAPNFRAPNKQRGLTTVEYAVAGALVAASLVMAFSELGDQVGVVITELTSAIGG